MNNNDDNLYLLVPAAINCNETLSSSDEDDSDCEVTSMVDERENELVQLDHLCINSDDTSDDDIPVLHHSTISNDPDAPSLEDNEISTLNVPIEKSSGTVSSYGSESSSTPSQKRKRKAWSIKEKLEAIENYDNSNNKHSTAKAMGCTRFQLSEWVKQKEELKNLQSSKRGKLLINKYSLISTVYLYRIVQSHVHILCSF
jgi:hypothetical protein